MKKKIIFAAAAIIALLNVNAQIPAGFVKGTVTLADASTVSGFVKDNIKKNAAVIIVDNNGGNKQLYFSNEVNAVVIDSIIYISVKSDFFKTICAGKICFLQKASNISGKTIYNGSEAIVLPGTDGKIGDYFYYSNNELTLINKSSVDAFISQLSTCTAAVEKAKNGRSNFAALADAVTIYNTNNK